ncbi:hypothetical protein, partial [Acidovorax sp.]|uniref:hypothetical protein n=1 Tax=Acidovorax sp. TaxID=1872122 RepID=UPI0025BC8A53
GWVRTFDSEDWVFFDEAQPVVRHAGSQSTARHPEPVARQGRLAQISGTTDHAEVDVVQSTSL